MPTDQLDSLSRFLRDHVSGYEELEALLLVARQPGREWTADEIAASLNVPLDAVSSALDSLVANGIVEVVQPDAPRGYRYAPRTEILRREVAVLQRTYSEQRLIVMEMMTTNALERLRTAALQRFADAFRLERSKR